MKLLGLERAGLDATLPTKNAGAVKEKTGAGQFVLGTWMTALTKQP